MTGDNLFLGNDLMILLEKKSAPEHHSEATSQWRQQYVFVLLYETI